MQTVAEIRQGLQVARLALQRDFEQHNLPQRLLRAHSKLIDRYLCLIWDRLAMPPDLVLVAVGGYGRGELYPRSDIDLLIVLPHEPDEALQQHLQKLIGMLWDVGLDVGHSIRTVAQCLAESVDITVQTNLLEARRVTGSASLFEELEGILKSNIQHRQFFLSKQQEQTQRYARLLDTDYNLEPNMKEGLGGLRDLHMVLWISRACGLGKTWHELAAAAIITPLEARATKRHEALLQTLRIRLHYLAGRREDRLLFEYQTTLAEQMHITATHTHRASEHLMQKYYRTKQAVRQLNVVLMQNLHTYLFPAASIVQPLNRRFLIRDDLLEARDEKLFEREPPAILESFLLLAQHPHLSGFSAATLRALWRARHHIDAKFRRDEHNHALFMSLLRQPQGLTQALRRMNHNGILGKYIPAFGRIVGQMQHDLFHVYTVDEHILMVVRNLRRFNVPQYAHEYPLCSKLIKDFARPEVLMIAGLFHDIAKGRGGDHSLLGRTDAARFCKQHRLGSEDTGLVVWLVEKHLVMSATAQKKDLSDQDVIAAYAADLKNDRYLVAQYLLTVADIRGTSPKVWNAWKGKLLEDLFWAARRYMMGGKIADQVGEIRTQAAQLLHLFAMAPEQYEKFWAQLDAEYFLNHEPQEIAWHTHLLAYRIDSNQSIVESRLSPIGEGLQVLVYSSDRPYLFARICAFFVRLHYNIMEAKIHSTQHGYALNSFTVLNTSGNQAPYRDVMNYIEYELASEIAQAVIPAAPHVGRLSRQLQHFPITPEVKIVKDDKKNYQLSIVAGDRPGLLAQISYVLARHNISVQKAKINTLGARAEDTFKVVGVDLEKPQAVEKLHEELLRKIS